MARNSTALEKTVLTVKQGKLIAALLEHASVDKAATAAGVSRRTAFRWLAVPSFQEELWRRRNVLADAAADSLKLSVGKAITTLTGLMDSADEKVKRLAAKDVVGITLKLREQQELEARIRALEEQRD